jgi:hypothetical protein
MVETPSAPVKLSAAGQSRIRKRSATADKGICSSTSACWQKLGARQRHSLEHLGTPADDAPAVARLFKQSLHKPINGDNSPKQAAIANCQMPAVKLPASKNDSWAGGRCAARWLAASEEPLVRNEPTPDGPPATEASSRSKHRKQRFGSEDLEAAVAATSGRTPVRGRARRDLGSARVLAVLHAGRRCLALHSRCNSPRPRRPTDSTPNKVLPVRR